MIFTTSVRSSHSKLDKILHSILPEIFCLPNRKTHLSTLEKELTKVKALIALFCLASQPHRYGKAAFEIIGVRVMSSWWRIGGSNP